MFALINCYSGNYFMNRLSAEIWTLLLEYNILPHFDYVPSKENIADVLSRPDLLRWEKLVRKTHHWKARTPDHHFPILRQRVRRIPREAWTTLWTSLYGGLGTSQVGIMG